MVEMEGCNLFLVSGTSAVLGHESVHPFDTVSQVGLTLDNLEALAGAASDCSRFGTAVRIDASSRMRVYVRRASDYPLVQRAISERFPTMASRALYLQGDICRQELMVEIELCTVNPPFHGA